MRHGTCVHCTTPASQLTNYFLSVWWHKTHHINLIFLVNSVQTKLRDTSETVELRCHYKTIKGNNICKHKLYTWDDMGMSRNYFKVAKYGKLNNTLTIEITSKEGDSLKSLNICWGCKKSFMILLRRTCDFLVTVPSWHIPSVPQPPHNDGARLGRKWPRRGGRAGADWWPDWWMPASFQNRQQLM